MRSAQDAWSPEQYHRFRDERRRPFFDLLARVERHPGMHAVDLGCGTGELTRILHQELQCASTVGQDNSPAMLAEAARHAAGTLRFELADIGAVSVQAAYDLIFSNAAIQWIDDHSRLLAGLRSALKPGGQLAVQIPANHDHPSHRIAAEVASEELFRTWLGGYQRKSPVLSPEAYALVLDGLGFHTQMVRLEVYLHHLASRAEVIEWVKGTLLTDYQKRMPPEAFARFLARYREALFSELPEATPFPYPFKRILFWGRLSG